MKTIAERFALAHWLDDYPDEVDYQDILAMIENGQDEDICYTLILEYEPPSRIIGYIKSTKALFAQYAAHCTNELQHEICRLESTLEDSKRC